MIDSLEQNDKKSNLWLRSRNIFLTGLFALLPLVVTYFFLSFLLDSMTGFLLPYFDFIDKKFNLNAPIFVDIMVTPISS